MKIILKSANSAVIFNPEVYSSTIGIHERTSCAKYIVSLVFHRLLFVIREDERCLELHILTFTFRQIE